MNIDILDRVRITAARKILFLPHALRQMNRPDRMIRASEVRAVIERGELIEDYPNDQRGHSCLLLGKGDMARTIHVVCSPKDEYLAIITAYLPDPNEWDAEFHERKSR